MRNQQTDDILRKSLHLALINRLIELYKKEKWKYHFIKNAKEKFNYSVQFRQLSEFEKGKPLNENIINVMLLEIMSYDMFLNIEIDSDKSVRIKTRSLI